MITPEPTHEVNLPRQSHLPVYVIRVKGCLDAASFSDWFGAMCLSIDRERGETVLSGPVADQAELYGLLARLRGMAMPLLSVTRTDQDQDNGTGAAEDGKPCGSCLAPP